MLQNLRQILGQSLKVAVTVMLVGVFALASVLVQPSSAMASSKAPTPEQLDLVMTEATQDFAASILDDYSDLLEDAFDAAIDPIKSSVKTLTKQISKSAKVKPGSEAVMAAEMAASQEALTAAVASLSILTETTDAFKAALAEAPAAIEAALQAQLETKLGPLDEAFASVTEAVDLLTADAETLGTDPEAGQVALTEHATLLTQAIEAADMAIDGFGD
jgi:FlaG/FlaF family flagellin (archaellin)